MNNYITALAHFLILGLFSPFVIQYSYMNNYITALAHFLILGLFSPFVMFSSAIISMPDACE